MKKMRWLLIGLLAAAPAAAQASDWAFSGTLYGWLPSLDVTVDSPFGDIDGGKSSNGVLDSIDMAFMATAEARYGRWGLLGDFIYADLSGEHDTPRGLVFSDAVIDTRIAAFSGYATYRLVENEHAAFDIAGGFRAFSVDVDTKLTSTRPGRNRKLSIGETWAVPLVGARVIAPFADDWFATAFADVGGLSGDNTTWQALASIGYRFNPTWSAQVAYRYMSIDKKIGGQQTEIDLHGPLIGVSAHF